MHKLSDITWAFGGKISKRTDDFDLTALPFVIDRWENTLLDLSLSDRFKISLPEDFTIEDIAYYFNTTQKKSKLKLVDLYTSEDAFLHLILNHDNEYAREFYAKYPDTTFLCVNINDFCAKRELTKEERELFSTELLVGFIIEASKAYQQEHSAE